MWYDTLRFTIHTPEVAMVRFVVEDYDKTSKNDFVGQYVLPLSCMQQGKLGEPSHTRIRQHNFRPVFEAILSWPVITPRRNLDWISFRPNSIADTIMLLDADKLWYPMMDISHWEIHVVVARHI